MADHLVQRLKSMTEAGTSGQKQLQAAGFQKFVANNEAALKEVLKPGEVSMLKAIAADLERSQRSVSGVKLPGRSNSPQDNPCADAGCWRTAITVWAATDHRHSGCGRWCGRRP